MEATEEELAWAARLKEAAKADPTIDTDPISDFEYLQHGIVAKDCTAAGLKRLRRLRALKDKYGIPRDGSYEQAIRDLHAFQAAHPGALLAVTTLPDDSSSFIAFSTGKFYTRNMKTPESLAITMRGFFYILQACITSVEDMRGGLTSVIDNDGVGWKNFHLRVEEQVTDLFAKLYPVRINRMVFVNAGWIVRALFSIARLFMSKKVADKHIFAPDRDEWLLGQPKLTKVTLPKEWGGLVDFNDLQEALKEKLQRRYERAAEFKL